MYRSYWRPNVLAQLSTNGHQSCFFRGQKSWICQTVSASVAASVGWHGSIAGFSPIILPQSVSQSRYIIWEVDICTYSCAQASLQSHCSFPLCFFRFLHLRHEFYVTFKTVNLIRTVSMIMSTDSNLFKTRTRRSFQ